MNWHFTLSLSEMSLMSPLGTSEVICSYLMTSVSPWQHKQVLLRVKLRVQGIPSIPAFIPVFGEGLV